MSTPTKCEHGDKPCPIPPNNGFRISYPHVQLSCLSQPGVSEQFPLVVQLFVGFSPFVIHSSWVVLAGQLSPKQFALNWSSQEPAEQKPPTIDVEKTDLGIDTAQPTLIPNTIIIPASPNDWVCLFITTTSNVTDCKQTLRKKSKRASKISQ